MRRPLKRRAPHEPDHKFGSVRLERFIGYVMKDGKKNTARRVVYDALAEVAKKEKSENPVEIFENALKNAGPTMEVRSRRVGGANYQVPREVRPERRLALSMRWIVDAAASKKGGKMALKLADEIIAASKNEGEAIKKKDTTHRMAEANKAFAHFAW